MKYPVGIGGVLFANSGKVCGYVDAEHSLDPHYAFEGIGADKEALIFQQPQAELDGDIGDDHVGLLARLMSQTLRRLAPKVLAEDATVIFINQVRSKIGDMFQEETTPGGRALKFYSSIRLRLSPSSHEKDGGETVGNRIYARCSKSKVSPPFRSDKLMIRYGEGLDRAFELRSEAVARDIVDRAGSWYKIDGETVCQGAEAFEQKIRENSRVEAIGGTGLRDFLLKSIQSPNTRPAP